MQKNLTTPPLSIHHTCFSASLRLIVAATGMLCLVIFVDPAHNSLASSEDSKVVLVRNKERIEIGSLQLPRLLNDGSLRLAFEPKAGYTQKWPIEWWQLAEREDRPGYPRIDPQSGGSGLPGARGEDEDPAYYSKSDYLNPELSSRIFLDEKYWLLDRPTHDSGFRFESWLVERLGQKEIALLAGISWGLSIHDGEVSELHHPQVITRSTRFNWHESLRISGFGSDWVIHQLPRGKLP